MRKHPFLSVTAALAAAAIWGCALDMDFSDGFMEPQWEPYATYSEGIWSEDDSAFAYGVSSGETKSDNWSFPEYRNRRFELFVSARNHVAPKKILTRTGVSDPYGASWRVRHYMREAGYLLVVGPEGHLRVSLDGDVAVVGTGPYLDVIPSPDGSRMAEVRVTGSWACNASYATTMASCSVQLRILNPATLEPEGPVETDFIDVGRAEDGTVHSRPVPVWSPEGIFYFGNEHVALRKAPGQPLIRQGPRACRAPKTSSGPVSSQRETIRYGYRSADSTYGFIFEPAHDSVKTFGCP